LTDYHTSLHYYNGASDNDANVAADEPAAVDHVYVQTDATTGGDDALRRTPRTIHLVENSDTRIRCIALGGYPPPSVDVYVGQRDVTDQLHFRHGATLTGTLLGMRRIDFRSERATDSFQAQAQDDREMLRCVVVVPGSQPKVEFVRLDVDCKYTLHFRWRCGN